MLNKSKFQLIKQKYGHYASWAIWADEGKTPKSNVEDLNVFDINNNEDLLKQLNPNIIFVGLNISRPIQVPLANFHDSRTQAMDFKIRHALKDSHFWGGYMTDIIKDFEQKVSGKVTSYLRKDKPFEEENIKIFQREINDLEVKTPIIVAFGKDAYTILTKNFKNIYWIIKIPHYSNYTSKEKYREEVRYILQF